MKNNIMKQMDAGSIQQEMLKEQTDKLSQLFKEDPISETEIQDTLTELVKLSTVREVADDEQAVQIDDVEHIILNLTEFFMKMK